MKSFLLLITFLVPLAANALISSPGSNAKKADGTVFHRDKVFIRVECDETTCSRGEVFQMDSASADGIVVNYPTTDGDPVACVAEETVSDGAFMKCQVYGYHDAISFSLRDAGPATAGQEMFANSENGDVRALGDDAPDVEDYHRPLGVFLEASAATASVKGFIQLL